MKIAKRHKIDLRIDEVPETLDGIHAALHSLGVKMDISNALLGKLAVHIERIAETMEEKNK